MLSIATRLNEATLVHLAGHLLSASSPDVKNATQLTKFLPSRTNLWESLLRVLDLLVTHNQKTEAIRLIENLDVAQILLSTKKAAVFNLVIKVFVALGRSHYILSALSSEIIARNLSSKQSCEIYLRVAESFIIYHQYEVAKKVMNGFNLDRSTLQTLEPSRIFALLRILNETNQLILARSVIRYCCSNYDLKHGEDNRLRLHMANTLFKSGEVSQAAQLLAEIDSARFFQEPHRQHEFTLYFRLVSVAAQDARLSYLLENAIKTCVLFDMDSSIALLLAAVNEMTMQGYQKGALYMLSEIEISWLKTGLHFERYAIALLRLKKFGELGSFLDCWAEARRTGEGKYHVIRAMLYRCLWQFDKAFTSVKKGASSQVDTISNAVWFARILNQKGEHTKALEKLDECLGDPKLSDTAKNSFFYEKGVSLRSIGRLEQALSFFEAVIHLKSGSINWVWMAYFEYALTSYALGDRKTAIYGALQGMQQKSYTLSHAQNPCTFLYLFLKDDRSRKKCPHKALQMADSWTLPQFPYHVLALILACISLYEDKAESEARERLLTALKSLGSPKKQQLVRSLDCLVLSGRNPFMSDDFISLLSEILWPFHASSSFERRLLPKLMECVRS